jgi:hypothetical protein
MGSGAAQVRAATIRSRAEVYNHRPSVDFTREGPTAAGQSVQRLTSSVHQQVDLTKRVAPRLFE